MPSDRWNFAQGYELPYQAGKAALPGYIEAFGRYNRGYVRRIDEGLTHYLSRGPSTRLLEIGCGPAGAIFFQEGGVRVGLDPLMGAYRDLFPPAAGGAAIPCIGARGEELPLKSGSVDAIILHNVLDHTDSPLSVLRESRRVLADRGVLYIAINTYSPPVRWASGVYECLWALLPGVLRSRLRIPLFRAHPHLMDERGLLKAAASAGLAIAGTRGRSRSEARRIFRSRRTGLFWRVVSLVAYSGGFFEVYARKAPGGGVRT